MTRTWIRRLHFFLGLYLLLFVWLFSISGLLLNHGKWRFAEFWPQRAEASFDRVIARPGADGDLAIARDLMRQLGIVGEVNTTERGPTNDQFSFQVIRPGVTVNVDADFPGGRAEVREIRVNAWGVLSALHHFTGVSMDHPERERDWLLTKIWSLAMDAVAMGLVVMVLSGVYLWYRLKSKHRMGLLMLGLGTVCCGFFLFGLSTVG